jgi:hypothetical protein
MNFGVGPIEYIYVCVCAYVCVVHGQVIKSYIWLETIRIIAHE